METMTVLMDQHGLHKWMRSHTHETWATFLKPSATPFGFFSVRKEFLLIIHLMQSPWQMTFIAKDKENNLLPKMNMLEDSTDSCVWVRV